MYESIKCHPNLTYYTPRHIENKLINFQIWERHRVGRTADQAFRNIQIINKKIPPRILINIFKMWWNAWFAKQRTGTPGDCCFCELNRESVAHFPKCAIVQRLWKETLNIDLDNHDTWWMTAKTDVGTLAKSAVGLYSTNSTMNHIHHSGNDHWDWYHTKRLFERMVGQAMEGNSFLLNLINV